MRPSSLSDWRPPRTGTSRDTPSACDKRWASRPRCWVARMRSSWTSPRTGSILKGSGGCASCSNGSPGKGAPCSVSSHVLTEMQTLADDVVIVAAGRLVRQGSVARGHRIDIVRSAQVEAHTPHPDRLMAALVSIGADVTTTASGALLISAVSERTVGDTALAVGAALHRLGTEQATRKTRSCNSLMGRPRSDDTPGPRRALQAPHYARLVDPHPRNSGEHGGDSRRQLHPGARLAAVLQPVRRLEHPRPRRQTTGRLPRPTAVGLAARTQRHSPKRPRSTPPAS